MRAFFMGIRPGGLWRWGRTALVLSVVLLVGCSGLLPSAKRTTKSPWDDFEDAQRSFDAIELGRTTAWDLKHLGFDPDKTSNPKVLNYVDLMQYFMPVPSITMADLDEAVSDCLKAKKDCSGYQLEVINTKRKRHGQLLLDMFNFNRKTRETGWEFKAIVVLKSGLVVYKLSSGTPTIDTEVESKNPLGPLQEPDDVVSPGSYELISY
jgi:hypothetical protein